MDRLTDRRCTVDYLVAEESFDVDMMALLARKRHINEAVIEADAFTVDEVLPFTAEGRSAKRQRIL